MLTKIVPDEKLLDDLSEVAKENRTMDKYCEGDHGDVKFYRSKSQPDRKFLRVWETKPVPEGKSGAATYVTTFYEVTAPQGKSLTRSPAAVK
jgi:hypothetical protein